jgi:hypothetical protein
MSTVQEKKQTETKTEIHYSANDLILKRYLELESEIKKLSMEFDGLKENLKHQGTHSTMNFVVTVSEVSRTQAPGLKTLVAEFGDRVRSMCTEITYKTVKVAAKGEGGG